MINHLRKRYPGADYKIVYEAGFCGFGLQRLLKGSGVDCIVVNPSDVPSSDKDKKRKTDRVDARKLSRELVNRKLKGIYVPDPALEHVRSLVRQRSRLVRDQTRCKNRIWQLIMFSGLDLQADKAKQYWSRRFMQTLLQLSCGSDALRYALDIAIEEYVAVRKLLHDATVRIRQLAISPGFIDIQQLLQTTLDYNLIKRLKTEALYFRPTAIGHSPSTFPYLFYIFYIFDPIRLPCLLLQLQISNYSPPSKMAITMHTPHCMTVIGNPFTLLHIKD